MIQRSVEVTREITRLTFLCENLRRDYFAEFRYHFRRRGVGGEQSVFREVSLHFGQFSPLLEQFNCRSSVAIGNCHVRLFLPILAFCGFAPPYFPLF
jgi:hypothetical protein